MAIRCPRCATTFTPVPGRSATCPKCGNVAAGPAQAMAPANPSAAVAYAGGQRNVAYDPGYASIGRAPVFVQAKPSWARPGLVTTAGILAIIAGSFDLIGAMIWLTFRDITSIFGETNATWTTYAILDIIIALPLFAAGVAVLGRAGWARFVLVGAAVADAGFSIFLVMQRHTSALFPVALDAVIVAAMLLPETGRYFATRSPTGV